MNTGCSGLGLSRAHSLHPIFLMLGISIQIDEPMEGDVPNVEWWATVDRFVDVLVVLRGSVGLDWIFVLVFVKQQMCLLKRS